MKIHQTHTSRRSQHQSSEEHREHRGSVADSNLQQPDWLPYIIELIIELYYLKENAILFKPKIQETKRIELSAQNPHALFFPFAKIFYASGGFLFHVIKIPIFGLGSAGFFLNHFFTKTKSANPRGGGGVI